MKTYLMNYLVAGLGLLALNLSLRAQSFALSSTPGVGKNPVSVVAADVNGDGKLDLICANYNGSTITVLTNDGTGVMVSNVSYVTPGNPSLVVAADLNGDGKVDLIGYSPPNLMVWTNNGSGGFTVTSVAAITVGSFAGVTVADINGDGRPDLICLNTAGRIMILTNAGNGSFALAPAPPSTVNSRFVVPADVNGDGLPDLIDMPLNASYFRVLTNAGNGTFVLAYTNSANTSWPGVISAADVNGDGWVDLIIPSYNSGAGKTVLVLTNDGHGFLSSNAVYAVGTGPVSVVTADVTGDGLGDLLMKNLDGSVTVFTNNGSGFGSNSTFSAGSFDPGAFNSVVAADVNGDGRLDLITANYNSPGTLTIWTNTSTFLPKLTVRRAGNKVVTSWPSQWTGWAGWSLAQNTDLHTANWTAFNGTIGDDGSTKSVTNSLASGNLFYRLAHP